MLEQDEELVEIVQELKQSKGRGEVFNPQRLKEKIEVIGPLIGLEELTNSIYVEAIDRLGESWYEFYGRLIKYKEREQNCNVPRDHIEDDIKLGRWVSNQRSRKEILTDDRLHRLNKLGFIWDSFNYKWENGFNYLSNFVKREGNCSVAKDHIEDGFNLGTWINHLRNKNIATDENQKTRLKALGFVWEIHNERWEKGFNALVNFKQREGNLLVPVKHKEGNYELGKWVNRQRTYKLKLSNDQLNRLDEIGFVWNALIDQWEKGYAALLKFKEREGNCLVPQKHFEDGFRLGGWITSLRQRKTDVREDQLRRLDEIGFVWDPLEEQWQSKLKTLVQFINREGHFRVPRGHIEDDFDLNAWIKNKKYNKHKLSSLQIQQLDDIGFIWSKKNNKS